MSETPAFTLTHQHGRSISMLSALYRANIAGKYLTLTEIARAVDARLHIPQPTLSSRRGQINRMVEGGLIGLHHTDDKGRRRYQITSAGTTQLARFRLGVRT